MKLWKVKFEAEGIVRANNPEHAKHVALYVSKEIIEDSIRATGVTAGITATEITTVEEIPNDWLGCLPYREPADDGRKDSCKNCTGCKKKNQELTCDEHFESKK